MTAAHDTEIEILELTQLTPYSDGRPWNEDTVIREIHGYTEQIVRCAYEIGRRLIWARERIGYGPFVSWLEQHLPFSQRSAYQYMQVAEFLVLHPKLLEPLGRASLNRVLLLTTLPEDQLTHLITEDGLLAESSVPLERVPFRELKEKAAKLLEERDTQAGRVAELEEQLAEEKAKVAELAGERLTGQQQRLLEKMGEVQARFFGAMTEMSRLSDNIGRIVSESRRTGRPVNAEMYVTAKSAIEGMAAWVEYERLRFDRECGLVEVPDGAFLRIEEQQQFLPEEARMPAGRLLLPIEDGEPTRPGTVVIHPRARQKAPLPAALKEE